jgi:hypothetical protein
LACAAAALRNQVQEDVEAQVQDMAQLLTVKELNERLPSGDLLVRTKRRESMEARGEEVV